MNKEKAKKSKGTGYLIFTNRESKLIHSKLWWMNWEMIENCSSDNNVILHRFYHLLALAENTRFYDAKCPGSHLVVNLRFLASGETQHSLSYSLRIRRAILSINLFEICIATYKCLTDPYLKLVQLPDNWKKIAIEFEKNWISHMSLVAYMENSLYNNQMPSSF